MSRARIIGLVLVLGGIAALGVSMKAMAQRLEMREVHLVWFGESPETQSFTFGPETCTVQTVGIDPDANERQGRTDIDVTWRSESFPISIDAIEDDRFPGLQRYGNWFRIIPMAQLPPGTLGGTEALHRMIADGELASELVVMNRRLPAGFDPDTWGAVRRKEWRYIFYVLHNEGLVSATRYERSYSELEDMAQVFFESLDFEHGSALQGGGKALATQALKIREEFGARPGDEALWAAAEALEEAPGTDPQLVAALRDQLRERFWQYQAMLYITPKLQRPKTKVVDYGKASMGWTWPVAGVSGLAVTLGVLMLGASTVRRDEIDPA